MSENKVKAGQLWLEKGTFNHVLVTRVSKLVIHARDKDGECPYDAAPMSTYQGKLTFFEYMHEYVMELEDKKDSIFMMVKETTKDLPWTPVLNEEFETEIIEAQDKIEEETVKTIEDRCKCDKCKGIEYDR